MKLLRYCFLTALACGVLAPAASAQFNNVGTSAANFLKIPVGPRGTALGGAYSALANDATSLYWNVAGLAGVTRNEVSLNTNLWLLDLRHDYLAAAFSLGTYDRVGVSVSYLSMGEMVQTTPAQPRGTDPTGDQDLTFGAYDVALGVAYARQLTDRFAAGVQAKYVRESIATSDASGFAFDLGLQYNGTWNGLRLGASISNFGPDLRMTGENLRVSQDPFPDTGTNPDDVPLLLETERFSLPIQFQFGAALTPVRTENLAFSTMLDVRDSRDFNQEIRLGGELSFLNTLFLRAGTNLFVIEGSFFGSGDDVIVEGQDGQDGPAPVGGQYRNPTTITRGDLRDGQPLFNLGGGLQIFPSGSRLGVRFDYAFSFIRTLDDAHRFGVSVVF